MGFTDTVDDTENPARSSKPGRNRLQDFGFGILNCKLASEGLAS
jgi:hypothetical protein